MYPPTTYAHHVLPPLVVLHWLEVFVKMRLMGASGPTQVKPLSNEKAVEIGAEIIGELIVYSIASSAIIAEYCRSSRRGQAVEDTQDQKISKLNNKLKLLDREMNIVKRKIHQIEDTGLMQQKTKG